MSWFKEEPLQKTRYAQPPPETITFEGKEFQLWTYKQMEAQGVKMLTQRATLFRDTIGAQRLPPLNTSAGRDPIIRWILEVEVALCRFEGYDFTFLDFGVPHDYPVRAPDNRQQLGAQKAMQYKGLESPFAAEYSENNPSFQPNLARPASRGGMPAPKAYDNATMESYSQATAGANAARQRNNASNIF